MTTRQQHQKSFGILFGYFLCFLQRTTHCPLRHTSAANTFRWRMSLVSLLQYMRVEATREDLKQIKSALAERRNVLVCQQDIALVRKRIAENGYCVLGRSYAVGPAVSEDDEEEGETGDEKNDETIDDQEKMVPGCEDLCKRLLYCPVRVSANDHIRARDVTIDSDQDDDGDDDGDDGKARSFHKHLQLDFNVHDKGLVMEEVDNDSWEENDADDPMHAETTLEVYLYTKKKHANAPKEWTDGARIRILNCDGDVEDWVAIQGYWCDLANQAKVQAAIAKYGGNIDNNDVCQCYLKMPITADLDDSECTLLQARH